MIKYCGSFRYLRDGFTVEGPTRVLNYYRASLRGEDSSYHIKVFEGTPGCLYMDIRASLLEASTLHQFSLRHVGEDVPFWKIVHVAFWVHDLKEKKALRVLDALIAQEDPGTYKDLSSALGVCSPLPEPPRVSPILRLPQS